MALRSPQNHTSLAREEVYVDTRSISQRLVGGLSTQGFFYLISAIIISLTWLYPALTLPFIILEIILYALVRSNRADRILPLRLPQNLNLTDFHTPQTANRYKFKKAKGNIFVGNELVSNKELWFVSPDLLTHLLLIGTTGAGKTQALMSLAASSSFILGGSVIYLDAKAAPDLIFYLIALARKFGREDGLRFMSYRTGNKEVIPRHWKKLTNTCGIFSQGTSSVVQQVLEDLMPPGGGENQVFRDRAIAALKALLPALVELRDAGVISLSPSFLGQMFRVDSMIRIAYPEFHNQKITYLRQSTGETVFIANLVSKRRRQALQNYLTRLPEFKESPEHLKNPTRQSPEVFRQFGFAEGYLVKPLTEIGSTFAHLFEVELGEVDFKDAIFNNRVVGIFVPATEQSKDMRQVQGKIALSSIRVAISTGLGENTEGDWEDVVGNLPVDLKTPSIIIVDEYAEVAVEGFAVTATQGRGLGTGVVFSGQDLAGFLRASEEETKQIFGNTRLKILMSIEDVEDSWEWFRKLASTTYTHESTGIDKQDASGFFSDTTSTSVKQVDRLDFLDVKEQIEGEAHIFQGSRLVRGKLFNLLWDNKTLREGVANFRFNRMLQVREPSLQQIEAYQNEFELEKTISKLTVSNKIHPKSLHILKQLDDTQGTDWIFGMLDHFANKLAANKAAEKAQLPQHQKTEQQGSTQQDTGQQGSKQRETEPQNTKQPPQQPNPTPDTPPAKSNQQDVLLHSDPIDLPEPVKEQLESLWK